MQAVSAVGFMADDFYVTQGVVFEQSVAEILFLAGVAKNIPKLKKDKALGKVIKGENAAENIHSIKESKAFRLLIDSNSREAIVEMAKSGNAKNLFDEYADCLADAKRAQPKRQTAVKKETHQLGTK